MTKYDVLRSLGMREYWYSISSSGCLVVVLQWHIEVVEALVDVAHLNPHISELASYLQEVSLQETT